MLQRRTMLGLSRFSLAPVDRGVILGLGVGVIAGLLLSVLVVCLSWLIFLPL